MNAMRSVSSKDLSQYSDGIAVGGLFTPRPFDVISDRLATTLIGDVTTVIAELRTAIFAGCKTIDMVKKLPGGLSIVVCDAEHLDTRAFGVLIILTRQSSLITEEYFRSVGQALAQQIASQLRQVLRRRTQEVGSAQVDIMDENPQETTQFLNVFDDKFKNGGDLAVFDPSEEGALETVRILAVKRLPRISSSGPSVSIACSVHELRPGWAVVSQIGKRAKVEIRIDDPVDAFRFALIMQAKKLVLIRVAPVLYEGGKKKRDRFCLLEIISVQREKWAQIADLYLNAATFLADRSCDDAVWEEKSSRILCDQHKNGALLSKSAGISTTALNKQSSRTRVRKNREPI